jgi:hypothetical protein
MGSKFLAAFFIMVVNTGGARNVGRGLGEIASA